MTQKLSFEEKQKRRKQLARAKIDAKPAIGVAHYKMGDIATVKLQVIKLTRYSVTMRLISGEGTIRLTTKNAMLIEDLIQIEKLPCSIVPTLTKDGITVEIPQGTRCSL